MLGDPVVRCVRLSARLSVRAYGLRYHLARQRFAPGYLCACRGCPLGARCERDLPASARRTVSRLDNIRNAVSAETRVNVERGRAWRRGEPAQKEPQP